MNKNCLSYWFPLIEPVVPTPRTEIIRSGDLTKILEDLIPSDQTVGDNGDDG